jgi:hypothetical protein
MKNRDFPSQEQDVTSSWGVCPFDYSADGAGAPPDAPPGPYVKCTNPNFNTANKSDKEKVIPTSALLFNDKEKALGCKTGEATDDCTKYLQYVIYHLISLIIIAFAFESLLREAPRIAVYLSGPDYTPPLAGGFAVSRGGQIRSLFSSSGGRDDSGSGGERKGLFSSLRDGLFGANDTPPKGGSDADANNTESTPPKLSRERMASLAAGNRPNTRGG